MKTVLHQKLFLIFLFFGFLTFGQTFNQEISADYTFIEAPGETITYTVTLTNTPNSTSSYENITVIGSAFVNDLLLVSGDVNGDSILNIEETWVYEMSFYVGEAVFTNNGIPVGSGMLQYEVLVNASEIGGVDLIFQLNWNAAINNVDTDGDGVPDYKEIELQTDPNDPCDFYAEFVTVNRSANWYSLDCDNDGLLNEEEGYNQDTDNDGIVDTLDVDDDNDGIRTFLEGTGWVDSDGDNTPNHLDLDSDNDGILDNIEAQSTANFITPSGNDNDSDGLDDAYIGLTFLINTDGDNFNDVIDLDSDNDGIDDSVEGTNDDDGDGIPNYRDSDDQLEGIEIFACEVDNMEANFELPIIELEILGELDPNTHHVTFHATRDDATNAINPLVDPYVSVTGEIFARMVNDLNSDITLFIIYLNVYNAPDAVEATLTVCSETDFASFELADAVFDITLGATEVSVTFYTDMVSAEAGVNAVTSVYTNTVSNEILYARVESLITSCYSIAPLTLVVESCPPMLVCGSQFIDSGDVTGDYGANESTTTTFCPDNDGDVITVTFISFNTETNYDKLKIYDGESATGTLLGEFSGTSLPPTFTSVSSVGCLTFVFQSDGSTNRAGWVADITCSPAPSCYPVSNIDVTFVNHESATIQFEENNDPQATLWEIEYGVSGFTQGTGEIVETPALATMLMDLASETTYDFYVRTVCGTDDYSAWSSVMDFTTTSTPLPAPLCGEIFTDSGEITGDYANNEDSTTIICPNVDGEFVTIQFTSFETENNFDKLSIYDGDISGNLLGVFSGTNLPPTFTSTDATGCLTFVFHSDSSVVRPGWEANVICGAPPTCIAPSFLSADNITATSAMLFWNENNDPAVTEWQIEYGEAGFQQGNGTLLTVTTNPYELTGLSGGTIYDFYVQSNCGTDDDSLWTSGTFETPVSCLNPSINSAQSGTYTDYLTIGWLENNNPPATSWEVEYGLMGFAEGAGTTVVVTSPTYTMTGRIPELSYELHVRSICGVGDFSTWSVITFPSSVPCDIPNGVTNQVFESTDLPTIADLDLASSVAGETVLVFTDVNCNGTPIDPATPLVDGEYYYAFQDGCCTDYLRIHVTLNITVVDAPYDVNPIPYQIYDQPLPNTTNLDDGYTDLIPLTFDFDFFGITYNQIVIGTNSVISFDASDAGNFCPWRIDMNDTLPSSATIDNVIMGVYQDYDNRNGMGGTQGYGFIGTAPFRKFVVFFDDVALYNTSTCGGINSANQMILYESYDYIDVQVKDRNVCTNWNDGNAILGIQNIGGTEAYFPADRNVGDWEAHNEGYRFKPAFDQLDFQYILCDPEVDGVEVFDLNVVFTHFNDNTSGIAYSIHETKDDALNNTNAISGNYTNTSNSQNIYVRKEDTNVNEVTIKNVLLATIDCSADYDLDTVDTSDEDLNGNGNYGDDDTDGDQIPNFIDEDDDGDFVLTNVEAVVTINRSSSSNATTNYVDTDGDNIPNYLDNDDDGDGILTINEDYDGDLNPANDDTNNDGLPDYLQQSVALGTASEILNTFAVYPNPAKDKLTIAFDELYNEIAITIYSINGQEVYKQNNITDLKTEINISNLSSGVYMINIISDDKTTTKKFVKE